LNSTVDSKNPKRLNKQIQKKKKEDIENEVSLFHQSKLKQGQKYILFRIYESLLNYLFRNQTLFGFYLQEVKPIQEVKELLLMIRD
jgi:hypothetical protein